MNKIYLSILASTAFAVSAFAEVAVFPAEVTGTDYPATAPYVVNVDSATAEQVYIKDSAAVQIKDNATLTLSKSSGYTLYVQTKSTLEVSGGGSLICSNAANGSMWLNNPSTVTIKADAGEVVMYKAVISGGTLVLEKENALRRTTGVASSIMIINNNSVLKATKSQEISAWDVRSSVKLVFGEADNSASNVKLSFLGITSGATNDTEMGRKITLENFDLTDSIYFDDISVIDSFEGDKLVTFDKSSTGSDNIVGKKCTYTFTGMSEALKLVTDKELGLDTNGATLMLASAVVNVPEPAEWAAIFGAIALGLAIYRRRK